MDGFSPFLGSGRIGPGGTSFEHPGGGAMTTGVGDSLKQHGWEVVKVKVERVERRDIPDVIDKRSCTEL